MLAAINEAKQAGDLLGGVIERGNRGSRRHRRPDF